MHVDSLTVFGFIAVAAMMLSDTLEKRYIYFTLVFAVSCWAAAIYGVLQGAWPFAFLEGVWGFLKIWHFIIDPRRKKVQVDPMTDLPEIDAMVSLASGRKCARSWKILREVGTDPRYPDVTIRDAAAVTAYDIEHDQLEDIPADPEVTDQLIPGSSWEKSESERDGLYYVTIRRGNPKKCPYECFQAAADDRNWAVAAALRMWREDELLSRRYWARYGISER